MYNDTGVGIGGRGVGRSGRNVGGVRRGFHVLDGVDDGRLFCLTERGEGCRVQWFGVRWGGGQILDEEFGNDSGGVEEAATFLGCPLGAGVSVPGVARCWVKRRGPSLIPLHDEILSRLLPVLWRLQRASDALG